MSVTIHLSHDDYAVARRCLTEVGWAFMRDRLGDYLSAHRDTVRSLHDEVFENASATLGSTNGVDLSLSEEHLELIFQCVRYTIAQLGEGEFHTRTGVDLEVAVGAQGRFERLAHPIG